MPLALVDLTGHTVAAVPAGTAIVVGRATECDVTLTDPTISRRHAEVRAEHGAIAVRDLGSRNGTFRNGKRVDSARVKLGEAITFGALTLRVAEVSASASATAQSAAPSTEGTHGAAADVASD